MPPAHRIPGEITVFKIIRVIINGSLDGNRYLMHARNVQSVAPVNTNGL